MKERENDYFLEIEDIVSYTECTGALPAQVYDEEKGENISELSSIHTIKDGSKTKTDAAKSSIR